MRIYLLLCVCLIYRTVTGNEPETTAESTTTTESVTITDAPVVQKPGECPRLTPSEGILTGLSCIRDDSECENDSDCEGEHKCCSDGCTKVCTYPLYTGCQQVRSLKERQARALGDGNDVFIPKCKKSGDFEPVQCNGLGEKCWCVDELGLEVAGTRARSLELVNCSAPLNCADFLCRMLCPYGFELDDYGCPLCKCRNPCEGVKCPAGQECQLQEAPCSNVNCPPLPTCKQPRALEGLCPVGNPLTSPDNGNPFLCGAEPNKPQCPPNFLCDVQFGNDYGVCCPLVDKPGQCPQEFASSKECGRNCSMDMDCEGVGKCCEVKECGRVCLPPANLTFCLQQKAVVELLLSSNPRYEGYIPQCTETGEFTSTQCSINGRLCWCVDSNGTLIQGTMGPAETVTCGKEHETEARKVSCPLIECHLECEDGYKYDEKGCVTCECDSLCEDMNCPQDTECILTRKESCIDDYCPPVATCHPKAVNHCRTGQPLVDDFTGENIRCKQNECPGSYFCEIPPEKDEGLCCPLPVNIESTKEGKCPDHIDESIICNVTCNSDSHCADDMKCCLSQKCGSVCLQPEESRLPTICEYLHEMGENLKAKGGNHSLAIPIPMCREDGSYTPQQCDDTGECWCVDDFGVGIINTRYPLVHQVDCLQARANLSCLGLVCRLGCDYGFDMDVDGCPLCVCRNPCKSAKCSEGYECQFIEVEGGKDWYPPVPQCVPSLPSSRIFPLCPVGNPLLYEDTNQPVTCDPTFKYQQCPSTHDCLIGDSEGPGICCPQVAKGEEGEEEEEVEQHYSITTTEEAPSEKKVTKAGSCPDVQPWESSICKDECQEDSDCHGLQKCCPNVCGANVCKNPKGVSNKEGQCPYLIPMESDNCEYKCVTDDDCEDNRKCCPGGCGTQCVYPVVMTACQHQRASVEHRVREMGIPPYQIYIPQCTEDGEFEYIQCDPVSKSCWCVHEDGVEITGTRAPSKEQVNCTSINDVCSSMNCSLACSGGFQLDSNGCPLCACHDPCEGTVCKNPEEKCRAVQVKCASEPCPLLPLCLPKLENPCAFGEPLTKENSDEFQECGPDGNQCPSSYSCHISPLQEYSVCCPKPRDVCIQEMDPGQCKASLVRWYFNQKENICEEFYFGGCGGNLNNFETKEHCEATCPVLTSCQRMRDRNLKNKNNNGLIFLPKCNKKTGAWEPTQCMESLGLCWCVDSNGRQISGSLVRGVPHCISRVAKNIESTPICKDGKPVHICPSTLCDNKACLMHKNAVCRVNPCGGCKAEFYDELNELVDCDRGMTACFAEVQEVLNSNSWNLQKNTLKRGDFGHPAVDVPNNDLPPPAYPPPPPPPMVMVTEESPFDLDTDYSDGQQHLEYMPYVQGYTEEDEDDLSSQYSSPSHFTLIIAPRTSDGFSLRMARSIQPHMEIVNIRRQFTMFETNPLSLMLKPGFCPVPSILSILRSMSHGCEDKCITDANCRGSKKCCVYKCGLDCIEPMRLTNNPEPKPGICPAIPSGQRRHLQCLFSQQDCVFDNDCYGTTKCCATACGYGCIEPLAPPPEPVHMMVAPPACSPEGGYAISQTQGELSWCVDKHGNPLHHTLTRGSVECDRNGTIRWRQTKGPVCPFSHLLPKVCKNECLKASCSSHHEAICISDPCNDCAVIFVNHKGERVNCQGKCNQNVDKGNCRSFLPRYFFNQSSGLCEIFMYGGCEGNDNNFETLEECEQECMKTLPLCERPKEIGKCKDHLSRWYYNKDTHHCEHFFYSGCGGNGNAFESLQECQATCPALVLCPWINVNGEPLIPCSRSNSCANATCLDKPDAVCTVEPCSCKPVFLDKFGNSVSCEPSITKVLSSLVRSPIPQYTRCQSMLNMTTKEVAYIPRCQEDGNFYPTQCFSSLQQDETIQCWCVNEAGLQLSGSSLFTKGTKICKPVKVKKVEVTLAFKHDSPTYSESQLEDMTNLMQQFLHDMDAETENNVKVEILPDATHIMFTLVGDNKVQVAFQLEEMVHAGGISFNLPEAHMSADYRDSHFYHFIDQPNEDNEAADNSISESHIGPVLYKEEEKNWPLILIVVISVLVFIFGLLIIAAITVHRRKMSGKMDEKPKSSLVSLMFNNVIYGMTGKKSESQPEEKKEPKMNVQTIEAQYETLKKQDEDSKLSEPPPSYDDVDEKQTIEAQEKH